MSSLAADRPRISPLWNVPNQLTFLRLLLSVLLFLLIGFEQWLACLVVFAVAAFTDWLDGFIARTFDQGTALGRSLDPLVDKVLNCGAFICLLPLGTERSGLAAWMVVVLVSRELIVTGLRSFVENRGNSFGADWAGKAKMFLQCFALVAIFVHLTVQAEPSPEVSWAWLGLVRDGLNYAMVGATLLSGLQYCYRAGVNLLQAD
jgi:CDP-diacylglycerol--glycerol-3-phosphate 3-phosphatidyltransferase